MITVNSTVSLKNRSRKNGIVQELSGDYARVQWEDDQTWERVSELYQVNDEKSDKRDSHNCISDCEACGFVCDSRKLDDEDEDEEEEERCDFCRHVGSQSRKNAIMHNVTVTVHGSGMRRGTLCDECVQIFDGSWF
jgi:hypothetical protein